jgi:hypothetical protein
VGLQGTWERDIAFCMDQHKMKIITYDRTCSVVTFKLS